MAPRKQGGGCTCRAVLEVVVCVVLLLAIAGAKPAAKERSVVILHVTDVHGWINGHPHTPELDADFGDFASLLEHLYAQAASAGVELLLFDSGDLIEGTGLSDASDVHGQYIFPIVQMVANYTAITIGNHDLGRANTVDLMRRSFIPFFNPPNAAESTYRYLTSNTWSAPPTDAHQQPPEKFLAQPWTIHTTPLGMRLLMLGFIFNFTQAAPNTYVYPVAEALSQPWFTAAMRAAYTVDLIVVPMHIDPQSTPEMQQIFAAIRQVHPFLPLVFPSGHRHKLVFEQLDANALTIESGKYFETIGIVRFRLSAQRQMLDVQHQWLPTSRSNFYKLTGTTAREFLTPRGLDIKSKLHAYSDLLHLNVTLGCSPRFYDPDLPLVFADSLYALYVEHIVPDVVFQPHPADNATQFFLTNSASLRYYLYAGRVTVNDVWTISPFKNAFFYYPGLSGQMLSTLLAHLTAKVSHSRAYGHKVRFESDFARERSERNPPPYYYSRIAIEPASLYDLVLADYDAQTLQPILEQLFPTYDSSYHQYPTPFTSTSALAEYIRTSLPCSTLCPC